MSKVKDLSIHFDTEDGTVPAVDGISFSIGRGETLGLVGESGCGKTVTSLAIMRLIPSPPGRIAGGEILFTGENLLTKTDAEMRKIRGNQIAMIFQDPMTSLNPVFTVGDQIGEAIILHQKVHNREARFRAIEMLRKVGIPSPEKRVDEYPHQMSGGMRQRVMIAMALSCNPKLLIADEPTTALDVTIQAQILNLMKELRQELETAIMLITHDLGIIAEFADKVVVMYAGAIIEMADVFELFKTPIHPYTVGLLGSIPRVNETKERLQVIDGAIPSPLDMPQGCLFHPRCKYMMDVCREARPRLSQVKPGHYVRCFRAKA
jgi:oligopeptide/dipeptide ABC transporter ATP-binding protein